MAVPGGSGHALIAKAGAVGFVGDDNAAAGAGAVVVVVVVVVLTPFAVVTVFLTSVSVVVLCVEDDALSGAPAAPPGDALAAAEGQRALLSIFPGTCRSGSVGFASVQAIE